MLRLPSAAGRFYPVNPTELAEIVRRCLPRGVASTSVRARVTACLVPHAGYSYSGPIAGAVFSRIELPRKILILGVRHFPGGENIAILSSGAWRTPLGDAPIDEPLAHALMAACPEIREDKVAHSREHSLEVQLPFLQVLQPEFTFAPIALGTIRFGELSALGKEIAAVVSSCREQVLLLATSDLNHYEDDVTTRVKDRQAIDRLLALDAHGLYDVCRNEEISMCGLGPATTMIVALNALGVTHAELVRYGTSAEVSGDSSSVVGYAGMIFGQSNDS